MRDAVIEGEGIAGETLAAAVRRLVPELSWSRVRALCGRGGATVDGTPLLDPASRLGGGERLAVDVDAPGLAAASGRAGGLPVDALVHVDADVVVVRKPAGMLTLPDDEVSRGTLLQLASVALRRLERGARQATRARGEKAEKAAAGPLRAVQRLDRDTTGLLVFARNISTQRHLQRQLADRSMTRRYLALAHGDVAATELDTLFVRDRGDGLRGSWGSLRRVRGAPPADGKPAVTTVEPVERLRGATLVSCRLGTGRQHQVRIHLAELGHPVVGETVYDRDFRRAGGQPIPAGRPLLHAAEIGFVHPHSGRLLRFSDPLPADFERVLAGLRSRR